MSGDSLPPLLKQDGGRWDLIQAYWPGAHLDNHKRGIYVLRTRQIDRRSGGVRIMPRVSLSLKIHWPVKNASGATSGGLAETEQRNLDLACHDLMLRIRGPVRQDGLLDKSHGGRFLSVGETPSGQPPETIWDDPEATIPLHRALRATCTYVADDFEVIG